MILRLCIMMIVAFLIPHSLQAALIADYVSVNLDTKKNIDEYTMRIEPIHGGKAAALKRNRREENYRISHILDLDYGSLKWRVIRKSENSDLLGERDGNVIKQRGTRKGKFFKKESKIDELPIMIDLTLGLMQFVKSERPYMEFWSLNPDNLNPIKLYAKKIGEEVVDINGNAFNSIKVEWGPTGFASMFYKQVFWFHKDTALFLKNKPEKGVQTLISRYRR